MTICAKWQFQIFCVLFSAVLVFLSTAGAKPTLTFSLPQGFSSFTALTEQFVQKRSATPMKTYSGNRVNNDSLIMVYYHDRTVAVTELGPDKLLLGCELVEIYNDEDGKRLLQDLSKLNRPLKISFREMLKLMNQCEYVDKINSDSLKNQKTTDSSIEKNSNVDSQGGIFPRSPFSILSGIIPGTKWCGTGDIAANYNDLGEEATMDRCCRAHDLCPIKIRAYQTRYELVNYSVYTKSHCICDDMLYSCLKKTNTSAAQIMGSIFFNVIQVPCVQKSQNGYEFRSAKEGF